MSTTQNSNIGFTGLLTLIFIACKLTGHITWPWIWVLCPLWIPVSIALVFLAVCLGIVAIAGAVS